MMLEKPKGNFGAMLTGIAMVAMTVATLAAGCSEDSSSGSGETTTQSAVSCEPTFDSINRTIFAVSCTSSTCHGGTDPAGALNLASGDPAQLVGASSGTCNGWLRVDPGSPENSLLWHKLYSDAPPCGDPMPLGGHLTAVQLNCIREWIQNLPPGGDAGPGCETCGGSSCLDLTTDPANCGACGSPCPSGAACAAGACECAGSLEFCSSACVDLQSNLAHCGTCDHACPAGAVCNVGQCICSGGLEDCGSACVEVTSDPANCGTCGHPCNTGEVCLLGGCSSGCDTLTQCGSSCVDTSSSVLNCGACGTVCPGGASCVDGACVCPAGTTECGGNCINTISDPSNCGGCGVSCSGGLTCESGQCRCPGGGILCGTQCVDEQTDPANCGTCGNVCGTGQTCEAGVCTCAATGTISFSGDVEPIFNNNCTARGCHSGIKPAEGMDLTLGRVYGSIVNVRSNQCINRLRVAPGDPAASYVMNKLMGVNLCYGSQMPKIGTSLPQSQLETIGGWICNGAQNN